ncbi:hypothetical protein NP92_06025 [Anoxybacillus gonensis]|nr:hypothetical protein AFK25_06270 [Anoxybacillus gonensis]KGP60781.1 hypothetical protein NP92_06025 [Anoxybacillus gonensis]
MTDFFYSHVMIRVIVISSWGKQLLTYETKQFDSYVGMEVRVVDGKFVYCPTRLNDCFML